MPYALKCLTDNACAWYTSDQPGTRLAKRVAQHVVIYKNRISQ